jgi:hypothetical protein
LHDAQLLQSLLRRFELAAELSGDPQRAHLLRRPKRLSSLGPESVFVADPPGPLAVVAETVQAEDHPTQARFLVDDLATRDQGGAEPTHYGFADRLWINARLRPQKELAITGPWIASQRGEAPAGALWQRREPLGDT